MSDNGKRHDDLPEPQLALVEHEPHPPHVLGEISMRLAEIEAILKIAVVKGAVAADDTERLHDRVVAIRNEVVASANEVSEVRTDVRILAADVSTLVPLVKDVATLRADVHEMKDHVSKMPLVMDLLGQILSR